MQSNSFVVNRIKSNTGNNYELRAKDASISFSFQYIITVESARNETLLGFHTTKDSMICVERRLIDESDDFIEELNI